MYLEYLFLLVRSGCTEDLRGIFLFSSNQMFPGGIVLRPQHILGTYYNVDSCLVLGGSTGNIPVYLKSDVPRRYRVTSPAHSGDIL